MRTQAFIQQYRMLEEMLEAKYSQSARHHSSVIMEYINDPESRPYRDQLNLCREIRNLIIHNADRYGQAAVEPSQGTLETLQAIVAYVEKPPLALSFATRPERILKAGMHSKVLQLMRKMQQNGFSHVPVIERQRLHGVFSTSTIFSYFLDNPEQRLDAETTVRTFRAYLAFERHCSEQFRFMDAGATYADVKLAFEQRKERNKRLAVIFITQTGSRDEELQGMITPWDVLGRFVPGDDQPDRLQA